MLWVGLWEKPKVYCQILSKIHLFIFFLFVCLMYTYQMKDQQIIPLFIGDLFLSNMIDSISAQENLFAPPFRSSPWY